MNIDIYEIKFGVRIARFNEPDEYARGELLRRFATFIQEEGIRHNFLVSDIQIQVAGEQK